MNPFEIISFDGGGCGGANITFKYNGKIYKTDSRVLSSQLLTILDDRWIIDNSRWTVNNVRWAFIPPDLTDNEKEQFVEVLNNYRECAIEYCKKCCCCIDYANNREEIDNILIGLFGTANIDKLRKWKPPITFFTEPENEPVVYTAPQYFDISDIPLIDISGFEGKTYLTQEEVDEVLKGA